jgi:YidC/Oxa1 family membrane protein insertase
MAAVIFGFMYINQPSEEELAARRAALQEQQDSIATAKVKEAVSVIDTLTSREIAQIAPLVKQLGSAENGVYSLQNNQLSLTVDSNKVTGTVKVGKEDVDVNALLSDDMTSLTPELRSSAVKALRKSINDLGKYKSFAKYLGGKNDTITLENDVMKVTFATRGGVISKVVLKDYKTETTTPASDVCIFNGNTNDYSFAFTTADRRFDTKEFNFIATAENDSTVFMSLNLGENAQWGIRYTLYPGEYLVKMEVVQKGMSQVLASNAASISFNWHQKMMRNEKGRTFEQRNSAIAYKYVGDSPDELSANKDDDKELNERVKWVAFKNQFFSSVIIPRTCLNSANIKQVALNDDPTFVKDMTMESTIAYSSEQANPATFDFYFGPNDYPLLSSLDKKISPDENLDLTRLVPLGWGIFRWINKFVVIPVFHFFGGFISNYGIIILLLTILLKIVLFPFTYKSFMSQAKMRVLAPEIKEINDRYPGQENAMVRQQKTMELYSKAGASPFSGCLPLILQMPILIAMFNFFPSAIELRGESFLWAKDLSAPDTILQLPFTIPFYGNQVSLFCLLMTAVNIIYTRINMQNQPTGQSTPGMKWMMYLMPVMFLFFFNDYASGLSYYYFLSLLITIVQTYVFRKLVDEKKVRAQMLANSKKPKKKSGFMARLEEAQRQQQAMLREQQKKQNKRK